MRKKLTSRVFAAVVLLALVGAAVAAVAASSAVRRSGSLVGRTQISFGCPGPVHAGPPSCNPWHLFAHGRFSIRRAGPDGRPLGRVIRLVASDGRAQFALRLSVGRYVVTPLAQPQTHGGPSLTVRIRAGRVTRILVRFQGYPKMA
jgi:hypothetical protein